MIKFFKRNVMFKLIVIFILVYATYTLVNQQTKLNIYENELKYYSEKIDTLKEEKEHLLAIKENVNSVEYIEEIAREKLDMYLPNERVFIDINK